MSYYLNLKMKCSFEEAVQKATDALKEEGFGVLTEIDIKEKLKEKINVDFRKYKILGACNPPFALKALLLEDKIGVMLPCNVIVQEWGKDDVEVAIVDPVASMVSVKNEGLAELALQIRQKLENVVELLK